MQLNVNFFGCPNEQFIHLYTLNIVAAQTIVFISSKSAYCVEKYFHLFEYFQNHNTCIYIY